MIPTSNHNEALAGDTLYSAFLNHEWRTIVMPFVIRGMAEIAAGIEDETERQAFEVRYGAMIDDFYNEEPDLIGTYYGARARRTTNQNVGSPVGAWYPIDFDVVVEQGVDVTPETLPIAYLTIPSTGTYILGGSTAWASNAGNDSLVRATRITLDGIVIARDDGSIISQQFNHSLVTWYTCTAGQIVRIECFTGVVNQNILALSDYSPVLWFERIR